MNVITKKSDDGKHDARFLKELFVERDGGESRDLWASMSDFFTEGTPKTFRMKVNILVHMLK